MRREAALRLARLLSLGLALAGGSVAWPALATGAVPRPTRLVIDAVPRTHAASPARSTDTEAHCEPDLSDHWALYRRIAARRLPESRATKTDSGARAE